MDQRGARKNAVDQEFGKVSLFQPKDGTSNDGNLDYELIQYLGEENGSLILVNLTKIEQICTMKKH